MLLLVFFSFEWSCLQHLLRFVNALHLNISVHFKHHLGMHFGDLQWNNDLIITFIIITSPLVKIFIHSNLPKKDTSSEFRHNSDIESLKRRISTTLARKTKTDKPSFLELFAGNKKEKQSAIDNEIDGIKKFKV